MLTVPDPTIERDAHQCTWTYQHRRCPEMIELHVHGAATPDGQDRTLCDRHERELQASRHRRLVAARAQRRASGADQPQMQHCVRRFTAPTRLEMRG
jgi:hypothetical protein